MIKKIGLILLLIAVVVLVAPHFVRAQPANKPIPRVDSVAYYTSFDADRDNNNSAKNIGGSGGEVVPVISLNQLPAGNYLVTVNAVIAGPLGCSLDPIAFTPNPPIGYWTTSAPSHVDFTEAVVITEQKDLTLYCQSGIGDMEVLKVGFAATKIDVLNITP